MNRLFFILVVAGLLVSHYAPAQSWLWAQNFSIIDESNKPSMDKDPAGNLVLCGLGFVAKYDAYGNLLWRKDPSTGFRARVTDVSTDTAGNIIIVGIFSDTLTFDTVTLIGPSLTDAFVVKYSSTGNVLWAKVISTPDIDDVNAVSTDRSGNIFVAGRFSGSSITIDTTTLSGTSDANMFLVKYSPSGSVIWGRALSSSGITSFYCTPKAIAVDNEGNVVVSGDYTGTSMTIGAFTLTASVGTYVGDIFVVKYSSTGTVLWAKGIASEDYDAASDVAIDGVGNSYIIGSFWGNDLYAGAFHLTNASTAIIGDVFVLSYDPLGNERWAKRIGSKGNNEGRCLATDISGNVYVSAHYGDTSITFGSTTLHNTTFGPSAVNAIVAKYNTFGAEQWAISIGGNVGEVVSALETDNTGNIYVYGMTASSTLTLGATTLSATGSFYGDFFFAKLSQTTSVKDVIENTKFVLLYPNPVSDVLTINADEPLNTIAIIDINGRVVGHNVSNEKEVHLNTKSMVPGQYFVILNNKVVKQFTKM